MHLNITSPYMYIILYSFYGKLHYLSSCSCNASWYSGEWTTSCTECGGYAMLRTCPLCDGECEKQWKRNVDMVHVCKIICMDRSL